MHVSSSTVDAETEATATGVIVSFGTGVAALVVGQVRERRRRRERAEDIAQRRRERNDDRDREDARYAARALRNLRSFAVNSGGPRSALLDDGDYEGHFREIRDGARIVAGDLDELAKSLGRSDVTQPVEKALRLMASQVEHVKAATRCMQDRRDDPEHSRNLDPAKTDLEPVDHATSLWLQASSQSDQLIKIHDDLLATIKPARAGQDSAR